MTNNDLEMDARTVIGNILLVADECSKKVITAFDPTAARAAINVKALSKFNLDILEQCTEFLNTELAGNVGNKLFTKETLVARIILAIKALLPTKCSECRCQYTIEIQSAVTPMFHFHMCNRDYMALL